MRNRFPGWIPADPNTLDHYWQNGIFAIDASVLLDLYRFSEEARNGLLDALRSFGDRLWVPHQVALEFHRNRLAVLLDQREAEGKLLGELDAIQRELDEQLSKRLRGAGRRDIAPLRAAIDGGFKELRTKLQQAEQAHTQGLGTSLQDDPIYDKVVELCGDRLGMPFDSEQLAEIRKDAEVRFKERRPPGYLDEGKSNEGRYGDVIIWHELCAKATDSQLPIVLVTDDRKADWVWEVRGKTVGPRPELVAEMREKADVGFYLYTPGRLFELWEERNEEQNVHTEILEEIRSPSSEHEGSVTKGLDSASPQFGLSSFDSAQPVAQHKRMGRELALSLEFTQIEIGGVTPGIRAYVTDGGFSAEAEFPMGLGAPGERHTVILRYPDDFPGIDAPSPGQFTVQWIAFVRFQTTSGSQETRQTLAYDKFVISFGSTGNAFNVL